MDSFHVLSTAEINQLKYEIVQGDEKLFNEVKLSQLNTPFVAQLIFTRSCTCSLLV